MSRTSNLFRLPVVVAMLLLAGCDGGGGSPAPVDYWPMNTGDRWVYEVTQESDFDGTDTYAHLVEVGSAQTVDGASTLPLHSHIVESGEWLDTRYLERSDAGLTEHFEPGSVYLWQPLQRIFLAHETLKPGDTFTGYELNNVSAGADYDNDRLNETVSGRATITVFDFEAVEVPAGRFPRALRVVTDVVQDVRFSRNYSTTRVTRHQEEWLVSGVGVVQRRVTTAYPEGYEVVTEALSAFAVGTRRTDSAPPEIVASSPEDGSDTGAWPQIRLTVNEAIDLTRLADVTFTVTDADGNAVTGYASAEREFLEFAPIAPLAAGDYRVRVDGVRDLLGNALPAHESEFHVDTALNGEPDSFFPLGVGDRWVYALSGTGLAPSTLEMETVSGTRTVAGMEVLVYDERDPVTNTPHKEWFLAKHDAAIYQVLPPNPGTGAIGGSFMLLHLPLQPGDRYPTARWRGVDSGQDIDGDGTNETMDVTITVSVSTPETVSTPVGSFSGTLCVTTERRWVLTNPRTGATSYRTRVAREWQAAGVGTVKRTIVETVDDEVTLSTQSDLVAYRAGTRRSEAAPPQVSARNPGEQSRLPPSVLQFDFSEALDLGALPANALSILDAGGQAVAGTLAADSRQLRFSPAQTLTEGRYTVKFQGVPDLLGNLASTTLAYTLDTTPPTIVSTSIADGATDVPVPRSIVIDMGEDVHKLVQYPGAIRLASDVPVPFGIEMDGTRLLVTPEAPLAHATTYRLTITAALTDKAGNWLEGPYHVDFTTARGLAFESGYRITLGAAVADMKAVDFNDDGQRDLVFITKDSLNNDSRALFISRRKPDGTLLWPVRIQINDTRCIPQSVAVTNVTDDGRKDIIVSAGNCGLLLYQRAADGTWSRTSPGPDGDYASRTLTVDLDADGRDDIVGLRADGLAFVAWFQQAGGGLAAPVTLAESAEYINRFQVADFSGDGLPDLFTLGGTGGGTIRAALTRQSAPRSFASPESLDTTGWGSLLSFAMGDLNNDGRQDLVFGVYANPRTDVRLMLQRAGGGFDALELPSTGVRPDYVTVADMDGDGLQDLVEHHSRSIAIRFQNASGGLRAPDWYPYFGTSIDLEGDGPSDLLMSDYYGELFVWKNLGMQ